MKFRGVVSILILILLLNFISPNFITGNNQIEKVYSINENIKGWINISFNNEPSDSLFTTSFGQEISLLELLRSYPSYNFECQPNKCKNNYFATGGEKTRSFGTFIGDENLYGFLAIGNITRIESVDFSISSNSGPSCNSQIGIDFLNDGYVEMKNLEKSEELCEGTKTKGCFDSPNKEFLLGTTPYCQRVSLPEAPGANIGAWIRKDTEGNSKVYMQLFNKNGYSEGSSVCELNEISSIGQEASCSIDTYIQPNDYYVCVYTSSGTGSYSIQGKNNPIDSCGFFGQPTFEKQETQSYNIFAQTKKFSGVGKRVINSTLPSGESLPIIFTEYIMNNYEGNCEEGCPIPIRIISGLGQTITLSNLSMRIVTTSGEFIDSRIYDLERAPSFINSNNQKLYFDNSRLFVGDEGNHTLKINFKGQEIISEEINVLRTANLNELSPSVVSAEVETNFYVSVTPGNKNVTDFIWSMGNGDQLSTKTNKLKYKYNQTGNYTIDLTIFDEDNLNFSKKFNIDVITPREAINSSLKEKTKNLENVKNNLLLFNDLAKEELEKQLDVQNLDASLRSIQREYSLAHEEEYIDIMRKLNEVEIPRGVYKTDEVNFLPFVPPRNQIDLDILVETAGKSYSQSRSEEYRDAVYYWNERNLNSRIKHSIYSADYNGEIVEILTIFDLNVEKKTIIDESIYLVIGRMEGLSFGDFYNEQLRDNYVYIRINDEKSSFAMATTGEVDFSNIPIFISPGIQYLSVKGNDDSENKESSTWFYILPILLVIFVILGYIYWKRNLYERYLFKDRRSLENLVRFIESSKRRKISEDQIINKLEKSGWSKNKIKYAIKKANGKIKDPIKISIKIPFLNRKNKEKTGSINTGLNHRKV